MSVAIKSQTTAERLSRLARLYENGQASLLLERTLDKAFAYEADIARQQLGQIQEDLRGFESQYQMSTDEFVRLFHSGATDDRMDYIDWASLAQMADGLNERIHLLLAEPLS